MTQDGEIILVDADELRHLDDINRLTRPFDTMVRRQDYVQYKRLKEHGTLKYIV